MTTYVNFSQPVSQPFSFAAQLDGNTYNVTIPSNLYGQRLYCSITALDGTQILCIALIGSPANYDINLVAGFFSTSTLIWRVENQQFEITP